MMKRIGAVVLAAVLTVSSFAPAMAGRRAKPIPEVLAAREVIEAPQEKRIRLGEDGKPRMIITSDLDGNFRYFSGILSETF